MTLKTTTRRQTRRKIQAHNICEQLQIYHNRLSHLGTKVLHSIVHASCSTVASVVRMVHILKYGDMVTSRRCGETGILSTLGRTTLSSRPHTMDVVLLYMANIFVFSSGQHFHRLWTQGSWTWPAQSSETTILWHCRRIDEQEDWYHLHECRLK